MGLFLITYELTGAGDYPELRSKLTAVPCWWHQMDSIWLVIDDRAIVEVRKDLQASLQDGDKLLVTDVTARPMDWYGLDQSASECLKASP